ncbi:unnamed protein product [Caenorhabditis auriculariae]|uniref:ATP-dependent RNA helicase n=1 Tax=Caenorhabditis auriculariae TaxID=2777116 RepID=A0A8S1HC54_9PELO|nr:unnamed protein product [Caenorhabditis auriculariae]
MPHTNRFSRSNRGSMKNDKLSAKRVKQKKKLERKDLEQKSLEELDSRYEELLKRNSATLKKFDDFPLSWRTLEGLRECEYLEPTEIQRDSLVYSLSGADVVGAAKTGSGKTLALVIPVLECLWKARWQSQYGLGALVISPTRELALQTFSTFNAVGKNHDLSCALLIGGSDVEYEKSRVGSVNIVVCTPGRLLQHMDENERLVCDSLQMLVLDEADRMLDMGFAQQLNAITSNLPRDRQTLLFSATQTRNVKDLSRVCTKDPVLVSVHEKAAQATPDNLKQSFIVLEEQEKLNTLWSFIVAHKKKKSLVFVSSCKQARFLTDAICQLRPGVSVLGLWGTMNQKKRIDVFQKFDSRKAAVMIATDVASRGLDFDRVDWVIQVDCPPTVDDYIHRVGRSARMNEKGEAVLFVTESQRDGMLDKLQTQKIPIEELAIDPKLLTDIRVKLRSLLAQSQEIKDYAQKSVVAYLRAVFMMKDKKVFDVNTIDAAALADSYGLVSVPRVRFLNKKQSKNKVETDGSVQKKSKREVKKDEDEESDAGSKDKYESLIGQFATDDLNEADEDLLTIKKKDVFNVETVCASEEVLQTKQIEGDEKILLKRGTLIRKPLTKQQAAKKIIKKNIKVNAKTKFESDSEDDGAREPSTSTAQEPLPGAIRSQGLDLEEAKQELKMADKEDRRRFRELRQKRKADKLAKKAAKRKAEDMEEDSDGEGPDLDWLPDPDEVRKRYRQEESPSDEEDVQAKSSTFSADALHAAELAALDLLRKSS